jgi:hypothetical protein
MRGPAEEPALSLLSSRRRSCRGVASGRIALSKRARSNSSLGSRPIPRSRLSFAMHPLSLANLARHPRQIRRVFGSKAVSVRSAFFAGMINR